MSVMGRSRSIFLFLLLLTYIHNCRNETMTEKLARTCQEARKSDYYKVKAITQESSNETHTVLFRSKRGDETIALNPVKYPVLSSSVPVWLVSSLETTPLFTKIDPKYVDTNHSYYENKEKMAFFVIYNDFERTCYDGFYGEGKHFTVIKSVPQMLSKSGANRDHVAYEIYGTSGPVSVIQVEPDVGIWRLRRPIENFNPELLIVIDYSLFQNLNRRILHAMRYIGNYWNAVNTRYSDIEQPRVQINVTGIIIAEDDTALDYITLARSGTSINASLALSESSDYFYKVFPKYVNFQNYDAVITMSGLIGYDNLGITYGSKICDSKLNIAFIRDDGCYTYNVVATHELGHLMDIKHDESMECPSIISDGTGSIMAVNYHPFRDRYEWSMCSRGDIAQFAWYSNSMCLAHSTAPIA